MVTQVVKGEVSNAFGKPVSYYKKDVNSIPFEGEFEVYQDAAEVRTRGEWPNDATIVDFLNAQLKANARAKFTAEALEKAGIEKPKADDPQVIHANMVKQLMLAKKDRETAVKLATMSLGYDEKGVTVE